VKHGWFADWDEEAAGFRPVLQTKKGTVGSLDIWFTEEDQCNEFIRTEVIGEGLLITT
jgi:hypothetical protein